MPNLRNGSTNNIVFPSCNICEKSVISIINIFKGQVILGFVFTAVA